MTAESGRRVLVMGATGSVGRLVVEQGLRRGLALTALTRDPAKLGEVAPAVRVVAGDALEAATVGAAVADQEAVVYALGAGNVRETTLFSDSTRLLLAEMERHGVRRLVCLTGVGAGDTKGHGGFLYDRILYPLFTKGIYADKDRQEALIRESDLDWTLVRAAPFRKRPPPGPLRVVINPRGVVLRRIALAEVAAVLLDEIEHDRHLRQAIFVGHE